MSQELTDARAISSRIKAGKFPKVKSGQRPEKKPIEGEIVTDVVPPMKTRTGIENIIDVEAIDPTKALPGRKGLPGPGPDAPKTQRQITTGQKMLPGRQFKDVNLGGPAEALPKAPGSILQGKKITEDVVDLETGEIKQRDRYEITQVAPKKKRKKKSNQ